MCIQAIAPRGKLPRPGWEFGSRLGLVLGFGGNFILRGFVFDIIRLTKELPVQS